MKNRTIKELLDSKEELKGIIAKGWLNTARKAKELVFLEINDGSCLKNLQAVVDISSPFYEKAAELTRGSSLSLRGDLIFSPAEGQKFELRVNELEVFQKAGLDYPLQKKRHSDEFLRKIAHLRPRTNKYSAMFRIRSELSFAVHSYYRDRGFYYLHSPILTASDCEGAGELFNVSTGKKGEEFFGKTTHLSVSGQLSAEIFALALGRVYTFGPTFRAENSNTYRHASEFWMIEPELAFADLKGIMDLSEDFLKFLISWLYENCSEDLTLFTTYVDKELGSLLDDIIKKPFARISYTEAIELLKKESGHFEFPPVWGDDLKSEHERFLAEKLFKSPVIVFDYPKDIKAFYMRLNEDERTVAAMDLLVPRIGELIGGSQREEREDILKKRMKEAGLMEESYNWYLDSRRWGSVPHSGFGMGFERLLMLISGFGNIRDVIPFPRTPGSIDF